MKTVTDSSISATPRSTRFVLYRHFDAQGTLLYVGQSRRFGDRMRAHGRSSTWWEQVAMITLETRESESDLTGAEAEAIQVEHPAYNITGRSTPRQRATTSGGDRRNDLHRWWLELSDIMGRLTPEDAADLEEWDRRMPDPPEGFTTSEWPGFKRAGLRDRP